MFQIAPSQLEGSLTIPSSKSQTLRAILFAALATGKSQIDHYLPSPDTDAMIRAVSLLGASVQIEGQTLFIDGFAAKPKPASDLIDCGNSGLVLRLVGAISALSSGYTVFTGDASIKNRRPVKPLLDALSMLGATTNLSPMIVKGPITKQRTTVDGEDSQPVSALLMLGAFAPHPIEIHVTNPKEIPWVDLTIHWLEKFSIPFERKGHTFYKLYGNHTLSSFQYTVPGDFSSAAFPIAAALLTGSELTIENLDMTDLQGDKAIIPLLQSMGANIEITPTSIRVKKSPRLKGARIDLDPFIDTLPILAVISCFSTDKTELFNGAIARKKESDRISAIAKELKKMGAWIEEKPDGLIIYPSTLQGAALHSHHDHRIALSLAVAAMAATGPSFIDETACIDKTYPNFLKTFQTLGAKIYGS